MTRWEELKADPEKLKRRNELKRATRQREAELNRQLEEKSKSKTNWVEVLLDEEEPPFTLDETPAISPRDSAMVDMYNAGSSSTEVAKAFGMSPGYTYTVLQNAGVVFRTRVEATKTAMRKWHDTSTTSRSTTSRDSQDEVCDLYLKGRGLRALSRQFHTSTSTIKNFLTARNIYIRTPEEQWKLMFGAENYKKQQ